MNTVQLDIGGAADRVLTDPRQEFVLGGPWGVITANGGFLYAQVQDEIIQRYGPRIYELMGYDSAVFCSQALLRAGVLADGLILNVPNNIAPPPGSTVSQRRQATEIELAEDILDFCKRGLERLEDQDQSADDVLWEMLDATMQGCSLAEVVFDEGSSGPDRGRYILSRFAIKPNWAWAFRVDRMFRVQAIRAWTIEGWADVERAKFALFTWQPRKGDPRGSSMGSAIYTPWNVKVQTYPEYAEFLKKFASASLVMSAGPDAKPVKSLDPITGLPVELSVQTQMTTAARMYKQHSVLGLPFGITASVLQSQGSGEAFDRAFDRFDRDIFRAMILSTRPVMEAKHGSKADSDSGMDLMGIAVQKVRDPLARMFKRDVLRRAVELNWGPEIAARLTPDVAFGLPNHIKPELMSAYADAWSKGLFDTGQRPEIWARIGMPMPIGGMDVLPGQVQAALAARAPGGQNQAPQPDNQPPPEPSAPAPAASRPKAA